MSKHLSLIAAAALAVTGMNAAQAVPIVYEGALTAGVTVGGFVNDPALTGSPNDDFWSFTGAAGSSISLIVNRLNADLDPAMELFLGVGPDTAGLTHLASADDNYPELPGFSGPFADPRIVFTLPETGSYTVQVWDFASGPQIPGGFCYQLTLDGEPTGQVFDCNTNVPEPASLALAGLGLTVFGAGARRRQRKASV